MDNGPRQNRIARVASSIQHFLNTLVRVECTPDTWTEVAVGTRNIQGVKPKVGSLDTLTSFPLRKTNRSSKPSGSQAFPRISSDTSEEMSLQFLSRGLSRHAFATARWAQHQLSTPASIFSVRSFATKKHKNLLKHAKGFRGRAKNCYSIAIRRVHKSWQYAYRDRKRKRREWHKLWIQRIQAGVRQYSMRYSEFYGSYRKSGMQMDRKILSDLAATEPFAFRSIIQVVEHQNMANGGN